VSDGTRTRRRPAVSDDDKLRRRDEIMAAAKKVFASNGFHSTTIADVAKEANFGIRLDLPVLRFEGRPV
jgi:AcrR family transcriptional regulator